MGAFAPSSAKSLYRRMRVRLRPLRRGFRKVRGSFVYPLRVIRIFPYVWRQELRERREFVKARARYAHLYGKNDDPLITVIIPTYNRAELLVTRAIPSVLAQSYENFEILVIGDCCTDDTGERLACFDDARIRFYNLPERPPYPEDKTKRWMIVGYHALNVGQDMARGLWLAKLDDDDMYMSHHLETLLRFAQQNDYEFVSSQSLMEIRPGEFVVKGRQPPLGMKYKTHSSYFWRSYLRVFRYEYHSWRAGRSLDKQILGKYHRAGVRAGFLEEPTVYYLLSPDPTVRTTA